MLLFYYINLVKLKMFWHFKIVGMTYSLGRRRYIIATQRCTTWPSGMQIEGLVASTSRFFQNMRCSLRVSDCTASLYCWNCTVQLHYFGLGCTKIILPQPQQHMPRCMSQPLSTYPRTVDFSLFIVVKCLVVTFGRYVDEQLMYLR